MGAPPDANPRRRTPDSAAATAAAAGSATLRRYERLRPSPHGRLSGGMDPPRAGQRAPRGSQRHPPNAAACRRWRIVDVGKNQERASASNSSSGGADESARPPRFRWASPGRRCRRARLRRRERPASPGLEIVERTVSRKPPGSRRPLRSESRQRRPRRAMSLLRRRTAAVRYALYPVVTPGRRSGVPHDFLAASPSAHPSAGADHDETGKDRRQHYRDLVVEMVRH